MVPCQQEPAMQADATPVAPKRSRIIHRDLKAPTPPTVVGGQGIHLFLADGRKIIDASGGAAVSAVGHQHPKVVAALQAQASRVTYCHTGFFTTDAAEQLADIVVGHEPGGLAYAFFVCGGSEATEAAIKLGRQHFLEIGQPKRSHIIARRQSYHGNTLGALSASGNAMRRAPYAPMLSGAFHHVSPAYAYRDRGDHESEAEYVARLAAELDAKFQELGPDTVMAFIAEPVVGATLGCAVAPAGYFQAMRAVCDKYGALLILDEVMCGMGRTGTMHAWEQEGVTPDLQIIAKGLGGGYQPIGAVLANERVVGAVRDGSGAFMHGHTYLAHPMACAAALAVQHVIAEENLLANVQAMGTRLGERMTERFGNHRHVGEVRGRGLFWAIELVSDRGSKAVFDPALKLNWRVKHETMARGMGCYPMGGTIDGKHGDHVLVAPPYNVTAAGIDTIVDILGDAVDAALASA
jgi:adenosylmethionine-8-amino-7-oxononanoate aminotransferase